ncbi:odorant receptor 4 [Halyomorpha halys]|uniref:odorant receptor 4 n=1 Tax=Halyomorpha halys TaxID=286706 RepID=UPI0034D1D484|nr:Odorant receptor 135 [Halyomorpha halys]
MDTFRNEKIALRLLGITFPKDLSSPVLKTMVTLYFWLQIAAEGYWAYLYFRGAYLYLHEHFLIRMVGLSAAISVSGTIAKLIAFKLNSGLLQELFDQLGGFVANTDRGKLVKKTTILYESAVAAILVTHNYGYFINSTPTRSTPYYSRYQTGPYEEVALDYWYTLYCVFVTLTGNVMGDTVFLLIINQICHRLLLLSNTVSVMGKQEKNSTMEKMDMRGGESDQEIIQMCVKEHNTLLKFKNQLEELYNYVIVVQLAYSFSTICLTLFVISQEANVMEAMSELLPQTISLFLEIFLYCWAGQMINNHFEELRLAVYNSGWYDSCRKEDRSSVLIMQTFTTVPVEVTAVSVFHLNFQLYETICREAFTYYTIMSQLLGQ